ncbi:MAG: SCO family protein [Marmoricola sp.]
MNRARLAAALAAVLLVAAGCGASEKKVDLSATVVSPPFTVAPGTLTTDAGKPYQLGKDTTAPLTLVFFGYTHCPDICPAVLSSITSGLRKLSSADQKKVQVLFITSDPRRDTGPVLHEYLSRFDPRFVGLTGSLKTVAAIGKSVGIFVDQGDPLAGGGYDPNSHSSYVIGLDRTHTAPVFWSGDTAPSEFARDFRFLLTHGTEHLKPAAS